MSFRQRVAYIWLPILSVPCYFLITLHLSESAWDLFLSEQGPVELGTAAGFFAASAIAIVHLVRHGSRLPRVCFAYFCLFAAAAAFVALEEISYGQHLVGFSSPDWFASHNDQQEINLHNLMGNKPSQLIRSLASICVPLAFVVFPVVIGRHAYAWRNGHWPHYLLPKTQLIAWVIIAQAVTLPKKLPESLLPYVFTSRLGELKELYWAVAALLYVRLVYRRECDVAVEKPVRVDDRLSQPVELPLQRAA